MTARILARLFHVKRGTTNRRRGAVPRRPEQAQAQQAPGVNYGAVGESAADDKPIWEVAAEMAATVPDEDWERLTALHKAHYERRDYIRRPVAD